jgi:hypothetical protein
MLFYDALKGEWNPAPLLLPAQTAVVDNAGNSLVDPNLKMIVEGIGTMATRLSVTVDQDGFNDGQTRRSELVQAAEMLWRIAHDVVTSNQLSGTVVDRNGVPTGHWTYTPTAPS